MVDIKTIKNPVQVTSATSNVFVDDNKKYVMKILKESRSWKFSDLLYRELNAIKYLKESNIIWVPEVINVLENKIVMSYCGEPISRHNAPKDYKEQIKTIINTLWELNLQHNDIIWKQNKSEFLVKDDRVYLVDWGWSSRHNDLSWGVGLSNHKPGGISEDQSVLSKLDEVIK